MCVSSDIDPVGGLELAILDQDGLRLTEIYQLWLSSTRIKGVYYHAW